MAVSRSRARLARPLAVAALAVAFCLAPVRAQQGPQPNFRSAIDVVSIGQTCP